MKNHRKILFLGAALSIISSVGAQAGTLTIINKIPDQRVYIFIQGEGMDKHYVQLVEANQMRSFDVNKTHTFGKPLFEVIASTCGEGNPNWKILGGTCSQLVTDADHTLVIESRLGKVSCTNVTADNPCPPKN